MDAIDTGVIGALTADATLVGLVPGGWFLDVAPQGVSEPFGVVSQVASDDEDVCDRTNTRYDNRLYQIKAVAKAGTASSVDSAAARIGIVLQGATLTATGFVSLFCRREERIRFVETDGDLRWQHAGGIYNVQMRQL